MTDRSGDRSRFDPRFDPAFQPGYDGAATREGASSSAGAAGAGTGGGAAGAGRDGGPAGPGTADAARAAFSPQRTIGMPPGTALLASAGSPDSAASGPAAAYAPTAASGPAAAAAAAASAPRPPGPPLPYPRGVDGSGLAEDFVDADDADDTAAQPPARSANPFLIALWVVSALMVFGGVALFQSVGRLTAEAERTGSAPYDYFLVQSLIFGAPLLMVLGVATATGILFVHAMGWRRR